MIVVIGWTKNPWKKESARTVNTIGLSSKIKKQSQRVKQLCDKSSCVLKYDKNDELSMLVRQLPGISPVNCATEEPRYYSYDAVTAPYNLN